MLNGDAADEELLVEENIDSADVFAALTNSEEANILSAMLAKRLGAHKVMALINKPSYAELIESGPIDIAISPQTVTIGSLLAHVRRGDVVRVHSLRRGAAEAIEVIVHGEPGSSRVVGRRIEDIDLPEGTTIGAIVRGEDVIIAHHDTGSQPDDHVILFVTDRRHIEARRAPVPVGQVNVGAARARRRPCSRAAADDLRAHLSAADHHLAPVRAMAPGGRSWWPASFARARVSPSGPHAPLQARAQVARRLPAGDARLGADGGGRDIPLLFALPGLSFTDAFFETTSGLTTTGSTVLTELERLPPAINLWRHALHWYGGMGIIVLALAILPLLGVGGMQLYKAETPGPMKDTKLTPRITETAKALWFIYAGMTVACIVALRLCGMSWFDAVCHGFSALALGGFSTYDSSVGHFDSSAVEFVLIAFMLHRGHELRASLPRSPATDVRAVSRRSGGPGACCW